jgi:hypothetical protein
MARTRVVSLKVAQALVPVVGYKIGTGPTSNPAEPDGRAHSKLIRSAHL